ncbi:hypothetical protein [Arcobacter roscoffensis]|uniref:Uncharacterized protein n=1 Tax=Arcobacter roscoffensis TaxID=2961520 RepID=A0ABY5E0G3_9BACT|nr:hypothetical protein [Arcobacter roscoffensis]UTJ05686.1 hypothetical protein NJU99_10485 [Arcobacter roscoffensis]
MLTEADIFRFIIKVYSYKYDTFAKDILGLNGGTSITNFGKYRKDGKVPIKHKNRLIEYFIKKHNFLTIEELFSLKFLDEYELEEYIRKYATLSREELKTLNSMCGEWNVCGQKAASKSIDDDSIIYYKIKINNNLTFELDRTPSVSPELEKGKVIIVGNAIKLDCIDERTKDSFITIQLERKNIKDEYMYGLIMGISDLENKYHAGIIFFHKGKQNPHLITKILSSSQSTFTFDNIDYDYLGKNINLL